MRHFTEEQRFNQWWLYFVLVIVLIGWITILDFKLKQATGFWEMLPLIIIGFMVLLVSLGIFLLRLETVIDAKGVIARFHPFTFIKKQFKWNEIAKIYVREYAPIAEYGGWGVRGLGKARAYNVSGNIGIQIVTNDRKNFLIGTNKPEIAKRTINYYRTKDLK